MGQLTQGFQVLRCRWPEWIIRVIWPSSTRGFPQTKHVRITWTGCGFPRVSSAQYADMRGRGCRHRAVTGVPGVVDTCL